MTTVKKVGIGITAGIAALVVAAILIPLVILQSILNSEDALNQSGMDACINYEVGSGISVNGLDAEKSANAAILVQDAMRRGLGKDGAAIAVMAALTESGMRTDPGGDNWNEPEYMWSMGMFQTKLWYQFQDAWKKPGGGMYPKSDPASIARAKAMALDPKQQSKWFFDRLSGEYSGTKSLSNFKWRTAPEYAGKPWMVAQKIEQSAFADGRNYKATWYGSKGIKPMDIVEAILNSPVSGGDTTRDATTFTTLDTAFPALDVSADGKYVIPTPPGAKTGPSGYPVIKDQPKWIAETKLPSGTSTEVAKWAQAAFDDLITRWEASSVLSTKYSLSRTGATIDGWKPYSGGSVTDYNSGTAVTLLASSLRKATLTPEETSAIQKIIRDMGGVISWGGASNPGYFYISPNISPAQTDGWATSATSLGQPPYFFVGDSIGRSIATLVTQNLPQSTVNAVDGRKTAAGITALRQEAAARAAKTWIVELGTNDGNNAAAFTNYVQTVMDLAGNRKVYWINAYRPASNGMGEVKENNEVLREQARKYPNLTIIDWNSKAVANLGWFQNDSMKLHPDTDGRQALMDLIVAAVTGNGNSSLNGISTLCGDGTGNVSNDEYVVADGVTGAFTDNLSIVIPGGQTARNRALSFVGNPPSSCSNYNCRHNCLHLASRAWGRASSGIYDAFTAWDMARAQGKAVTVIDPKTGKKNPEAFNIPIGALVYWNPQDNGHVATYVGDGKAVTNGDFGKGQGVYLVPMEAMNGYGTGYQGWAYPVWGY